MSRILRNVRPTKWFDPCQPWLIWSAQTLLDVWIEPPVYSSLWKGEMPNTLRLQLCDLSFNKKKKKSSLDSTNLNNYWPVSNLPFLGKVTEQLVAFSTSETRTVRTSSSLAAGQVLDSQPWSLWQGSMPLLDWSGSSFQHHQLQYPPWLADQNGAWAPCSAMVQFPPV